MSNLLTEQELDIIYLDTKISINHYLHIAFSDRYSSQFFKNWFDENISTFFEIRIVNLKDRPFPRVRVFVNIYAMTEDTKAYYQSSNYCMEDASNKEIDIEAQCIKELIFENVFADNFLKQELPLKVSNYSTVYSWKIL